MNGVHTRWRWRIYWPPSGGGRQHKAGILLSVIGTLGLVSTEKMAAKHHFARAIFPYKLALNAPTWIPLHQYKTQKRIFTWKAFIIINLSIFNWPCHYCIHRPIFKIPTLVVSYGIEFSTWEPDGWARLVEGCWTWYVSDQAQVRTQP